MPRTSLIVGSLETPHLWCHKSRTSLWYHFSIHGVVDTPQRQMHNNAADKDALSNRKPIAPSFLNGILGAPVIICSASTCFFFAF